MIEASPRPDDFQNVRDQLLLTDRIYERTQAAAQARGLEDGVLAIRRRRALVGELLEFLEARQDLGELARTTVAFAPASWIR